MKKRVEEPCIQKTPIIVWASRCANRFGSSFTFQARNTQKHTQKMEIKENTAMAPYVLEFMICFITCFDGRHPDRRALRRRRCYIQVAVVKLF